MSPDTFFITGFVLSILVGFILAAVARYRESHPDRREIERRRRELDHAWRRARQQAEMERRRRRQDHERWWRP